jgi:hypothetical protein
MRRKLPAFFRRDYTPNVGPFYSSDAETATYGGTVFIEFVLEGHPKLGG